MEIVTAHCSDTVPILPKPTGFVHRARCLVVRPPAAALAAVLLVIYFVLALSAASRKGPAFDEVGHLASGYNMWRRHDFRLDPANGDFSKRWSSLPLLISRPTLPPVTDPMWRHGEQHVVGFEFLYRCGNDPALLLTEGRAMTALLGVLLGILVYRWAAHVFGTSGGVIALAVYAFAPNLLAHGALVTTDMAVTLGLFAATGCFWRLLHHVSFWTVVVSLLAAALLATTKLSAVAAIPVALILSGFRVVRNAPWSVGGRASVNRRACQAALAGALLALHVIAAWIGIWAAYDFRYRAAADVNSAGLTFQASPPVAKENTVATQFLDRCEAAHVLPQAFVHGTKALLLSSNGRLAFMDGKWRIGGWHSFFPFVFWLKTPPASMLLVGAGILAWLLSGCPRVYNITPVLVLAAVYAALAISQHIDIGDRHILPIYPCFCTMAGAAGLIWSSRRRGCKVAVVALLSWLAADSTASYPDYLGYFNRFAGGPSLGFRHLADSSVDWGMDLPQLGKWLKQHDPAGRVPVYFAYFGTGDPDYYGIKCRRLPGFFDWRSPQFFPLRPGYYAISATLLDSLYTPTAGPWDMAYEARYHEVIRQLGAWDAVRADAGARRKLLAQYPAAYWDMRLRELDYLRFGRLCAWLRNKWSPVASVGHSILIWRLDGAALQEALAGPPAELVDADTEGEIDPRPSQLRRRDATPQPSVVSDMR